jgi:DNA-binding NtrC family response regulator
LTRAVVLTKGETLGPDLFVLGGREPPVAGPPFARPAVGQDGPWPLHLVEKEHISRCLTHTGWNKRRACALLEISRPTLDRKIEQYELERPADAGEE